MTLSAEQILTLAPDSASAKAGVQQSSLSKWSAFGANEQALWGLCQGSGKSPYVVMISRAEPAFKCNCPSRKFPCKHGLGLYLLYAQNQSIFTDNNAPEWMNDWLTSRGQRAEKQAEKKLAVLATLSPEEIEAKEKGQQKRQNKRLSNVENGIKTLESWLEDLAREGLADLKSKLTADWDAMAANMVDAQATGLATRVRTAGTHIHSTKEPQWELAVARELSMLALLIQGYRRLTQLPPELQSDIKTAIGWTTAQDDVIARTGIDDTWQICGNYTQQQDRVSSRACYLRGMNSHRWAMILQFSAGGQSLPPPLIVGMQHRGTMHFYPSAAPLRAVFGADMQLLSHHDQDANVISSPVIALEASIDVQLERYAQALAANPFITDYPIQLHTAIPQYKPNQTDAWWVNTNGTALPLHPQFQHTWRLHSLAGGHPITLFGLWNGSTLLPLSVLVDNRLYSLDVEFNT